MGNKKSARKTVMLVLAALAVVVAGGLGIWYYLSHSSGDPVYVYNFEMVGMTEYWGDSKESYGPVTTDRIQTVFLTDTQTVTSILVEPGDMVKKGDILMTFDTTLSDLALERKRLEVEKVKLHLEQAQKELRRIQAMKPMSTLPDIQWEEDAGVELLGEYLISEDTDFDGSAADKALICWLHSDNIITDKLLEALRQKAEEYQNLNAQFLPPVEEILPEEEEAIPTEEPIPGASVENPDYVPFSVTDFHVVIKVTEGNLEEGSKRTWQGMHVWYYGGNFSFRLENALVPDHMLTESDTEVIVDEGFDPGSGLTAAQIAELRIAQEKKIRQLEFDVKMAEANYRILQTEMGDGNVYAQLDGEVVSVLTEEEAKENQQPVLKVSGGGGFYIEGYVSELDREKLLIGQEVTVNDWNTGMTYVGTVQSMGDFPSEEYSTGGMGNPSASYYPFQVYVDGSADLQEGRLVSVTYSTAENENGVYLQNPYLRTEGGTSYVLVMGEDGLLEKRIVRTGKSLWGSYTEILDGITAEDLVAFPYGKHAREGVPTVEGDYSTMYE